MTLQQLGVQDALSAKGLLPLGPTISEQLIPILREQKQEGFLTEEQARAQIEAWVAKRRLSHAGFSVDSLELDHGISLLIHYAYHTEARRVVEVDEPWDNQPIEESRMPEDVWSWSRNPVFQDGTEQRVRGGTGRKVPCSECARTAVVDCHECNGSGRVDVQCGKCKGSGTIERKDKIVSVGGTSRGSRGAGGGVVLRKEQCIKCQAEGIVKKPCKKCRGNGKITCPRCRGTRDLYAYQAIESTVKCLRGRVHLSPHRTLKVKWLKDAGGEEITLQGSVEPDRAGIDQVLSKCGTERVLWELYEFKVIPTVKAVFLWRGKSREIFILSGQVYSRTTLPFLDRRKVVGITGATGVLAFIATLWAPGFFGQPPEAPAQRRSTSALLGRAVVTAPGANLRARPAADAPVLGQVLEGDTLLVRDGSVGNWNAVRSDGVDAFINSELVRPVPSPRQNRGN